MAWTNPSANPPSGGGALYYSGGNVGIGTTGPNSKLEVAGTIHSTTGGIKFPDGTTQGTNLGVAKAWVYFNRTTILGSYNVSSISNIGTPNTTVNFTTPFANTNYVGVAIARSSDGENIFFLRMGKDTKTTGSINIGSVNTANTQEITADQIYAVFYGN